MATGSYLAPPGHRPGPTAPRSPWHAPSPLLRLLPVRSTSIDTAAARNWALGRRPVRQRAGIWMDDAGCGPAETAETRGTAPCRRTSSSATSRPGGCRAPTAPRGPHGQASLPASATASSIPPSRSWTGPRSVRSAPPPSWLVDAASLEEAVTLAKGCRVSRRRWCPGWRARPASASPGARICGSSKTPSSVTSVYSMLRLGPAIAGAIVREGHLDPSQVARPAVLLVRTDECPLGISRGRTRGTATRPPNPGNSES